MNNYSLLPKECDVDIETFCQQLSQITDSIKDADMHSFISALKTTSKSFFLCRSEKDFFFNKEMEKLFFSHLLGIIPTDTVFTKYTSLDSLIRICRDNEMGMVSLLGMNDSTEGLYADNYFQKNNIEPLLPYKDNVYVGNFSFITSFSLRRDELTMWRLYGNEGKGVAIHFKSNKEFDGDWFFAPISYACDNGNHNKLNIVIRMMNIEINGRKFKFEDWLYWRYFFKPYDFHVEKEVRLLYSPGKPISHITWIRTSEDVIASLAKIPLEDRRSEMEPKNGPLYPLDICGVTLGPNNPETRINIDNIQMMLYNNFALNKGEISVAPSEICNYRVPV